MMNTIWAEIRNGRIELLEPASLPEGSRVLVTVVSEEDEFWLRASQESLKAIWDNPEDDVYGELLKK